MTGEGSYLICFDFPEAADPVFAGWTGPQPRLFPGFVSTLAKAARFGSWAAAERFLVGSYGPSVRNYGAVVELAEAPA